MQQMKFSQLLRIAAVMLGSSSLLLGGDFMAPAEGPVPFRRDKLPLEVEQIASLSNHVESLVLGLDPTIVTHRRAAAQMLALATALDPSNKSARELITDFQLGNSPPSAQSAEVGKAQMAIWQTLDWLKSPAAGESAHALARDRKSVV